MNTRSLVDYEPSELVQWCLVHGQPAFRARQLTDWVYRKLVFSPDAMTDLSKAFRAELAGSLPVLPLVERRLSRDPQTDTRKWLFELTDGNRIETVSIPDEDGGYTICISSQAGCGLKCAFCATGMMGYRRNLSAGEIVAQVLYVSAALGRPAHVVFMGMGEPFHNYDAVLAAVRTLTDPKRFALGARRLTISTAGMVPEIYRLAEEDLQVNLAISLGGTTNAKRAELIPLGEMYTLDRVLRAADHYAQRTGRRVSYEYVLLRGRTDSRRDAERLVELFAGRQAHVNLILWNRVPGLAFESPTRGDAARFRRILEQGGVSCTLRLPRGRAIHAACGQLAITDDRHPTTAMVDA